MSVLPVLLCTASQGTLPLAWLDPTVTNDASQPTVYPRMYALTTFTCEACGLTGALPNWDGPNNLVTLRLKSNSFTGMLPTWDVFDSLEYLDVSYCGLTGLTPASW